MTVVIPGDSFPHFAYFSFQIIRRFFNVARAWVRRGEGAYSNWSLIIVHEEARLAPPGNKWGKKRSMWLLVKRTTRLTPGSLRVCIAHDAFLLLHCESLSRRPPASFVRAFCSVSNLNLAACEPTQSPHLDHTGEGTGKGGVISYRTGIRFGTPNHRYSADSARLDIPPPPPWQLSASVTG